MKIEDLRFACGGSIVKRIIKLAERSDTHKFEILIWPQKGIKSTKLKFQGS
jgi:hypothetical protein